MANPASSQLPPPGLSTQLLHADQPDHRQNPTHAVTHGIDVSTTFRSQHYDEFAHDKVHTIDWQDPGFEVYSRYNQNARGRTEKVLSTLMKAQALTYGSGLAAATAALTHYAPSVIAIRRGYMGVHEGLEVYKRMRSDLKIIDLDDEYPTIDTSAAATSSGDSNASNSVVRRGGLLVWVETPLNPTGEARDLKHYAQRAHTAGGYLGVDSTFAPPPLQDPFVQGADLVMHSATKYLGGHSDLLVGVLAVKTKEEWQSLFFDRIVHGAVPGNLESFLLLRSLRTLTLRVTRQSQTAQQLALWLHSLTADAEEPSSAPEDKELVGGKIVQWVWHASLQPRTKEDPGKRLVEGKGFDPREQMPGGFSGCFSFRCKNQKAASIVPHSTTYFTPATSLGGVEALLEHRVLADKNEDPALVRISVGLEEFADLQHDLRAALRTAMAQA